VARASFDVYTGGDQMTQSVSPPRRLDLVIAFAAHEYRRSIATCADPAVGSALGGGTPRELDVAYCDGEYWLISEAETIRVDRIRPPADTSEVARFVLPAGLRAIHGGG
jgi:hypothetical protein